MSQPVSPMSTPLPWDLVSSAYAEEVVPAFERYAKDALRIVAPPPGVRIVDVACGPGTLSVLAARAGYPVDAIDFSPKMIELLRARSGDLPITMRQGDGQALPYEAGTFSAAFSMFGLMFFPDRAKGFAELRRVLTPGARAGIATWQPLENAPVLAAMFGAVRGAMAKLLGPDAPPPAAPEMPLATEEACRTEMGASFGKIEVHALSHVERYASADVLWASLERTMAPLVLMKRNLGDKFAPVAEAARAAIGGVVGPGPAEMTMNAWLTVGTAV